MGCVKAAVLLLNNLKLTGFQIKANLVILKLSKRAM